MNTLIMETQATPTTETIYLNRTDCDGYFFRNAAGDRIDTFASHNGVFMVTTYRRQGFRVVTSGALPKPSTLGAGARFLVQRMSEPNVGAYFTQDDADLVALDISGATVIEVKPHGIANSWVGV